MLGEEERQQLLSQLSERKKRIRELKDQLRELNAEKEKWYAARDEIGKKVTGLITGIKETRGSRDQFTQQVRQLKDERDRFHQEIRKKIEEVTTLRKQKDQLMEQHHLKGDPSLLRKQIEHLEHKIETEPMDFSTEQRLMKDIREKRKQVKEFEKTGDTWKKLHEISQQIEELKKKAEEKHRMLQDAAKTSQSKHENILEASKGIDQLRTAEEEGYKQFFDIKQKIVKITAELDTEQAEASKVQQQLDQHKQERQAEKKKIQDDILKTKEEHVQDKIKKRQKLTTEDLLVYQRTTQDEQ